MLAIFLAGGVSPRSAAWTIDAVLLYVSAHTVESSLRGEVDRGEVLERLRMLPASHFPHISGHVDELNSGEGHERFEFAIRSMLVSAG